MLDGSHFFECDCGADEHTLRFVLNKDEREIYTSVFLCRSYSFFERLTVAFSYLFNITPRWGHFGCWIMRDEDATRLRALLDEYDAIPKTTNQG